MYIENTAKIRSTPKWQEAMDQSLFVTGGGGGGFWKRSHGFQGGLKGGGKSVVANRVLEGGNKNTEELRRGGPGKFYCDTT